MISITYFVHCTTTDNEQGLATGWLPGELSEIGREQAKKLRQQTANMKFDVVFCSDLKRAVDTANITFDGRFPIIQDERLRECNYGQLDGKPKTFKENMENFIDQPFPGGESYRDVQARIKSFCEFLKEKYDGKHVAVMAHEAPQLALDVILKNKSWQEAISENWRKTGAWRPGWEYVIAP